LYQECPRIAISPTFFPLPSRRRSKIHHKEPRLGHFFNRTLQGRFGAATTFLGGRPLPYGETGHDVFLVDARAAVRLKEVELSLDAFNLLDAEWYDGEFTYASNFNPGTTASLVPARHVTVGAPRTVWVSLALYL